MVSLLRSLHDGMEAEVTIGKCTSPAFSMINILRQGCSIVCYLGEMLQGLRCEGAYKYSGKLVGERMRRPLRFEITKLLSADDT